MQIKYSVLLLFCCHVIYLSAIIQVSKFFDHFEEPKDKLLFPESAPSTKLEEK